MREMKDSGIEWIGDIPKNWNMSKIGSLYTQRNEKVSDKEYQPLSVTMQGVLPQLASAAKTDDGDNRKLVRVGDFAINSRSDRRGSCGISPLDGSVSLINIILTPRTTMHPGYYDWLFHTTLFADEFYKWGHGIVADLWTTRWQEMKSICVPVPEYAEQKRISEFLNSECAEIDAVLEKTRASIDEYKKLKQTVITQAVTKGIRGGRPMKDSGESFLHKVPVGWTNSKIKYCAIFSPLCNTSHLTEDSIVTFTPMECIKNGYFENREAVFASMNSSYTQYQEGDIVFAKVTPCFENGNIAIMQGLSFEFGFGSSELFVLRPKSINTKFLFYYLQNDIFKQYACATMTGTGGLKRVSPSFVRNFPIFLPSDSEQADIAEYLDYKCKEIDLLISKKQQYLTEIENYKKSLIYEYATGKKECPAINQNDDVSNAYPYFPAPVHASSPRFAQAVLMSKILEESSKGMGRVKLEKTLFTIENHIGFNFDTEYLREAAGPLDASIYECEKIITRRNKWFSTKTSSYGVSYAPTNDVDKYKKYYAKYFSEYNSEIERIIDVFRNYTTEQAEIIATLFAAWNDAIIDKKQFTDDDIVDDVLNNWHESKRRFPRQVWLRAMNEIRKNHIIPKGYGKHTVMKEMQ
ncbi:restriction endonuclease subunit S [Bittarella massiliensis (ex Durand et al. 2017)]|jgi:type I restriction enzyme S subunit|uniref:Type I restriction modification DNA specificity domain-containing protein n=1 Tax=Bittarella massiliensis (ex Durand et al. 2017) TaxID=1720313 RepID=A0ABW9WUY8_9FIRM|nr:restriction endonuclease subunit S [Bittarella massiliensis (ex Durand et al. 2017)]MZL68902.1 hypothetical protein [Bittarella massiliensis (ex Durand et al. 2017)]MZL80078.1 hypothetical protein [Bittarella massiliensis (ex Durand et al. 2017)]